jgi:hypothetical protein
VGSEQVPGRQQEHALEQPELGYHLCSNIKMFPVAGVDRRINHSMYALCETADACAVTTKDMLLCSPLVTHSLLLSLTSGRTTQKGSGWKATMAWCLSTQKLRVGVWQGPYEMTDASRLPYLPWK